MKQPPILDLTHLERQTFGDRSLERELLMLFEGQCVRLLPAIAGRRSGLAPANAAHTLRGAALAVGAGRIALLAGEIERAGEGQGHTGEVEGVVTALERAVDEIVSAIADRVGQAS